jgi:RHH-type rel operon transcriptional repressor/antitoxin RelB
MLGVRLDEELQRRLTSVARTQGRSKSDVARDAIRRYVDENDLAFLAEARRQSLRAAERGWTEEDRAWEALAAADDPLDDLDAPRGHAAE